jgi:hypothetical protein
MVLVKARRERKSPHVPLCKGGLFGTNFFPLFDKQGLGKISQKVTSN